MADVGCGLGYTTQAILAATRNVPRGVAVTAVDLQPTHLSALQERVQECDLPRLTCLAGNVTEVAFAPGSLDGVLACRVLHFLSGEALRAFFSKCCSWLKQGAPFCMTCETPYIGPMARDLALTYDDWFKAGVEWPGYTEVPPGYVHENLPHHLHLLEPRILRREAIRAGFTVHSCDYLPRPYYPTEMLCEGRESASLIAVKP